jgi:hypothetical protein
MVLEYLFYLLNLCYWCYLHVFFITIEANCISTQNDVM